MDGVLGTRTQGPQDGLHRRNHGAMAATWEREVCMLIMLCEKRDILYAGWASVWNQVVS